MICVQSYEFVNKTPNVFVFSFVFLLVPLVVLGEIKNPSRIAVIGICVKCHDRCPSDEPGGYLWFARLHDREPYCYFFGIFFAMLQNFLLLCTVD